MHPNLWGPAFWQLLFVCSYACHADQIAALRALVLDLVPPLIPCKTCRGHYLKNIPYAKRRASGSSRQPLATPRQVLHFLWHMKDRVNLQLQQRSVDLAVVVSRFEFHGPAVDEVRAADTLMVLSLWAHTRDDDDETSNVFVAFCMHLSVLLPRGALQASLARLEPTPTVVAGMLRAARSVRSAHGASPKPRRHYEDLLKVRE